MIKALIFDFGGVILTNDWGHHEKEHEEYISKLGMNKKLILPVFSEIWQEFKIGKMTEDEMWKVFLQKTHAKQDIALAKKIWRHHQRPLGEMLGLLKKIKKQHPVFGLSNIAKEWLDYKVSKYNLQNIFTAIISSAESGVGKPDEQIYQDAVKILKKHNIRPEEAVFIDNMKRNLAPARKVGLQTIHFTSQEALEPELIKLGIHW